MLRTRFISAAGALASAGLGFAGNAFGAPPVYNTIALTGSTGVSLGFGPNQGAGITFKAFDAPVVNASGTVAFYGELAGPGLDVSNDDGIWTKAPAGTLTTVARVGAAGPQPSLPPGVRLNHLGDPLIDANGKLVFGGLLEGTGVTNANDKYTATNVTGPLAMVARNGSTGPGPGLGAGVDFNFFNDPRFNLSGTIAFNGNVTGTGINTTNDAGIWSIAPGGSPTVLARTGSAGPGPNVGANINFIGFGSPSINPAGKVAFSATLTGTGINATNNAGLWTNTGGPLGVVARTGSTGPGPNVGAGVTFQSLGNYDFNNAGQVAFKATLTGTGIVPTNSEGIWKASPGGPPTVLARAGSTGPGPNVGAGVNFSFFAEPVMNSSGTVAFKGVVAGTGVNSTNELGIWTNKTGPLAVVARTGAPGPGPGLGAGVVFADFSTPYINNASDLAFIGRVTGTGVTSANQFGIFATDHGSLVTVARMGNSFDIDPGPGTTLRTISDLTIVPWTGSAGPEDGRPSPLNDNGLLTFQLIFTDGSQGVFTATVPEPASGAALLIPALASLARRHRRRQA